MSEPGIAQEISLEILRGGLKACQRKYLDMLELEDSSLSQLHPLARIIALHEQGLASRVTTSMLQNAAKTIAISGVCEFCDEEVGDDWDLTYYRIAKAGRGVISSVYFVDPAYNNEFSVDFQLRYEMSGGSMDGFSAKKSKRSLSVKDLPLATEMIKSFGSKDLQWPDHLLSAKSKFRSSLDPGFDNLDGEVTISLEAVSLRLDSQVISRIVPSHTHVATLQYGVGQLTDASFYFPVDISDEQIFGWINGESSRPPICNWSTWLPFIADKFELEIIRYCDNRLRSATDGILRDKAHHALTSLRSPESDIRSHELHLNVEEIIKLSNCTDPSFWDISFSLLGQKKHLPPGFNAQKNIGWDRLSALLLKMVEVSKIIARPEV